ncbi:hypothetical protein GWA97_10210 [Flavobacterium sp. LaA7.5]|nr:hypothetical protein [Flavobacterium salilacus subsp. altitudinum]
MKVKDLEKYSNTELEKEIDTRLQNLEEEKSNLYSWDEVKSHLKNIRKSSS